MRSFNLNIAGYNIGFESVSDGPGLSPSPRFNSNINHDPISDILIRVHSGTFRLPNSSEKVFRAPFTEQIKGVQDLDTDFWSIWKYHSVLYIRTSFPLARDEKNATLKFSFKSMEWDLWIDGSDDEADPFEYPLDGLILYYLTVINGDIMIHASGINNAGKGYLFSGVSGKGKSTMARIWDKAGATIIHDDRLIIRHTNGIYRMFNTPVYNDEVPRESKIDKIFLIDHGKKNCLVPINGAKAVSQVMANCIQHNWGNEIIARLLGSVTLMCSSISVSELYFKPDRNVIDIILEYE